MKPHLASAGLLVAGVFVVFWSPLRALVDQWSASPMYSHAFTVPFISLGLLWSWRDRFAVEALRPARLAAAPVLGVALLMVLAGGVAAVQIVQQLAFVVALAGIVLFLFGFAHLRISAPAIAYLLFMVPFWDVFTEPLHAPFQQNSAQLGVALMQAVNVPAYREGTIIALPNVVLEVARACSGVNYLVAVLALALPLALLRLHDWWRRVVLVVSAIVISALANGARVALIGVLAYLEIGSPLHGPFHVLHGLFVAGIGYVVLFAGLYWLESPEDAHAAPVPFSSAAAGREPWRVSDALALALVFWAVVFVGVSPSPVPVALAQPLAQLPLSLGDWTAGPAGPAGDDVPTPTTAWTDADDHLHRQYFGPAGQAAAVDIWYFAAQRQSREVVSFKVAELHERSTERRLAPGTAGTLTVNAVTWPERREVGLFWYELGGAPESREFAAKLRSVWSTLRSGRSNAAAIMVTAGAPDGQADAALTALEDLARRVHVGLAKHWPTTSAAPLASAPN
jgi:EpsI family protein